MGGTAIARHTRWPSSHSNYHIGSQLPRTKSRTTALSSIPHGRGPPLDHSRLHGFSASPSRRTLLDSTTNRPSGVVEDIDVESSELSEPAISQPPVGRDIEVDCTCAVAFTPTY